MTACTCNMHTDSRRASPSKKLPLAGENLRLDLSKRCTRNSYVASGAQPHVEFSIRKSGIVTAEEEDHDKARYKAATVEAAAE